MAEGERFKGPGAGEGIDPNRIRRPTESVAVQVWQAITASRGAVAVGIGAALIVVVFPRMTPLLLLLWPIYAIGVIVRYPKSLPLKLPIEAKRRDPHDPLPGRSGFKRASGRVFLGWCRETRQEIWIGVDDLLTHALFYGTTGAGKTETMVSIIAAFLPIDGGVGYLDPKGDPKVAAQMYILARLFGRDDDFLVRNFVTDPEVGAPRPKRLTNTTSPFASGDSNQLADMLMSMMPPAEGQNASFALMAQTAATAFVACSVDLRDQGYLDLSPSWFDQNMNLKGVERLLADTRLRPAARQKLETLVNALAYNTDKSAGEQSQQVQTMWGYARGYLGRPLQLLAHTYGHIYDARQPEIDELDVIQQRRIAVTILPSMQRAPADAKNLGTLEIAQKRIAVSAGLGRDFEGTIGELLDRRPTIGRTPFLNGIDEYAAVPAPGAAELLTQGRSLGVANLVGTQDAPGMRKADEEGAGQIKANTILKAVGKLEDAKETWEEIKAHAGQTYVAGVKGASNHPMGPESQTLFGDYRDTGEINYEPVERVSLSDLQEQREGEFHLFMQGMLVRAQIFYAGEYLNVDKFRNSLQVRITRGLQVELPSEERLQWLYGQRSTECEGLRRILAGEEQRPADPLEATEMPLVRTLRTVLDHPGSLSGKSLAAAAVVALRRDRDERIAAFEEGREAARGRSRTKPDESAAQRTEPPGAARADATAARAAEPAVSAAEEAEPENTAEQAPEAPETPAIPPEAAPPTPTEPPAASPADGVVSGKRARAAQEESEAREVLADGTTTEEIAADVAATEEAVGGADPQTAQARGREAAERVAQDTQYPPQDAGQPVQQPDTDLISSVDQAIERIGGPWRGQSDAGG